VDAVGKAPLLRDSAQDVAGGTAVDGCVAAMGEGAADASGAGQASVAISRRAMARRKLSSRV
jgi:hypothetical protein